MTDIKKDRYEQKEISREISALRSFPVVGNSTAKVYLYIKSQRLLSAMYMVTNHIKDTEPCKKDVRYNALAIVRGISRLSRTRDLESREVVADIAEAVLCAISNLEALIVSGLLSETNGSLIKKELYLLMHLVQSRPVMSEGDQDHLKVTAFDVPAIQKAIPSVSSNKQTKKNSVDQEQVSFGASFSGSVPSSVSSGLNEYKGHIKDNRVSSIINLLKTQSNLSVKDFLTVIPNVSEKTIQRELIDLSDRGVLIKSGARRWTRYSLAPIH